MVWFVFLVCFFGFVFFFSYITLLVLNIFWGIFLASCWPRFLLEHIMKVLYYSFVFVFCLIFESVAHTTKYIV